MRKRTWRTWGKGHSGNKAFTRWKDKPISSHGIAQMLCMADQDFISQSHREHHSDFRMLPELLRKRLLGGGESLWRRCGEDVQKMAQCAHDIMVMDGVGRLRLGTLEEEA